MGASVDLFPGYVGGGDAYIRIVGIIGHIITLLHYIGAALDPVGQITFRTFLSIGTVHACSVEIYVGFHFQETLFILFICTDCHGLYLPFLFIYFFYLFSFLDEMASNLASIALGVAVWALRS